MRRKPAEGILEVGLTVKLDQEVDKMNIAY